MPACNILHGDKGYDTNALRRQIEAGGAMPNIPPKAKVGASEAERMRHIERRFLS